MQIFKIYSVLSLVKKSLKITKIAIFGQAGLGAIMQTVKLLNDLV